MHKECMQMRGKKWAFPVKRALWVHEGGAGLDAEDDDDVDGDDALECY